MNAVSLSLVLAGVLLEASQQEGATVHMGGCYVNMEGPQFSTRADLRATAFAAWTSRGETGGPTDNRAIVAETLALRGLLQDQIIAPATASWPMLDGQLRLL